MASLNKVFLIGRLTRDPELRYTPSGSAVASFGLAVNREYTTKDGSKKEDPCFVNLVVWGKRAEVCAEYLKKGSMIFVEGRLSYRKWETQDKEKRSTIEVSVENFQFLDRAAPDIQGEIENGAKDEGSEEEKIQEETSEGM
ncbi:MAG: single-stranded DNA-binding protein [Candidatus Omnitrophica bacterium]|nr:single-stranded DNA-binding protein [Candidatus Omnitrophota bacterium]MCM8828789.1 single-stranded DNA-binding protein [Candidatus Omnitrophota bacterium]